VELGAFVLVPESSLVGDTAVSAAARRASGDQTVRFWPVVGKSLIDEWVERVRRIGVQVLSIAHGPRAKSQEIVRNLAKNGVEQILVISLKAYAEIDLDEFMHFHRYAGASSTEAFDPEGSLGVEVVNRASLFTENDSRARASGAAKYRFSGYAKRLRSTQTYRDLVSDALSGRCALTPRGSQIEENVWIGEETQIAPSVRFLGPCFVGDRTAVRDFVTIGPFSSVENECRIDCGTVVEGSSILPNTFLAAGLNVRRSIVDGPRLEHLDSGTIVDLRASSLGRRFHPKPKARGRRDRGTQARNSTRFAFEPSAYATAVEIVTPLQTGSNRA
jgi:hypothetical protein